MKKFEEKMVETQVLTGVVCDLCNKEIDEDLVADGDFIQINQTFGYFSKIIGDMTTVSVDICEDCFNKHILSKVKNPENSLKDLQDVSTKDLAALIKE